MYVQACFEIYLLDAAIILHFKLWNWKIYKLDRKAWDEIYRLESAIFLQFKEKICYQTGTKH